MSHRLSKTGIRHLSSTHTRGSELCFYWHGRVLGFYKITSSAFYRCRCVSSQVTLSRRFSWIHKKLFFPFFVFPYVLPALFIWSLKYALFWHCHKHWSYASITWLIALTWKEWVKDSNVPLFQFLTYYNNSQIWININDKRW